MRAAGLDLRIGLAPYDDHDEWLGRYEERLPKEVVERARRLDRELVARALRASVKGAPNLVILHEFLRERSAKG